jgi:hypothetical protein
MPGGARSLGARKQFLEWLGIGFQLGDVPTAGVAFFTAESDNDRPRYARLKQMFPGVNDDHTFQRFLAFVSKERK